MYQTPVAVGVGTAAGVGAISSGLQGQGVGDGNAVVSGAHQVLAFTGFAFGAYVLLGALLILTGLVLRRISAASSSSK